MNTNNQIELELRAEISVDTFEELQEALADKSQEYTKHKRLSIIFLSENEEANTDLRLRVNNLADGEVVLKTGDFHSHDRTEISQAVQPKRLKGLARIFGTLRGSGKIIERETHEYYLPDDICFSLVKAGSICYAEIEKMTNEDDKKKDRQKLEQYFNDYNLEVINKEQFDDLCGRLTEKEDISFNTFSEVASAFDEKVEKYIE